MHKTIASDELPKPIGPYSPAIKAGELLFLSGQVPLDPATGRLKGAAIEEQTQQALDNVEAVLRAAGATWHSVVRVEIFLKDLSHFPTVNEIYAGRLPEGVKPARQTVEVSRLPMDALIEISCISASV